MSDRKELFWDEERQQQYWIEWIETGNNDIPTKHYISNKNDQIEPPVKPATAETKARIEELERVLRLNVGKNYTVFLMIPRVDITDKITKLKKQLAG